MSLNPHALRAEFPMFEHYPELVYLDNAATTQKPRCVLDAERHFYETANANVHRSAHRLSGLATEAFEGARETVARFLNASSADEIVFTRGATEAINLVANSWGSQNLKPGDEILVSGYEHHANIVPWQLIAAQTGAIVREIPVLPDGTLDRTAFLSLLQPQVRMVAITHASNAIGTHLPVLELAAAAHVAGARVLIDGAQAVAHESVDVQALGADFYVFSGHKVYGPTGVGVLYGKAELLADMPPWQGGGDMIERVSFAGTTYAPPPARFEAGTPPVAQAVGLAAALNWLCGLDRAALKQHEAHLCALLDAGLRKIAGVRTLATVTERAPLRSLVFDNAHPYDVAQLLDARDIAVRVGKHCAEPLLDALGVSGTLRVSFAAYNTAEDVTHFLEALAAALEDLA
ncbi:cysteine sulfinate desulfinase [Andreprevotia lacus DSM 23236]|jgi:cysteine sulfinate desulfinase/cysteine desulfurase/selenocysteine lyase|uniref:Probable cysteine desulfurase n=1 Tax=Andreprevotia lacus DSM 23236 TaxID=1121001 RepID=A0A1W1XDT8_9NEIS|nr:cysteine desulfurase [Andreprevotia lacus]SMC22059.1 cysteine sulfinate desulfinase [Andreprevotia lacus DSM 23236]